MTSSGLRFWFRFDDKGLAKYLRAKELEIGTSGKYAVRDLCKLIHQRAMEDLESKVKWGHSVNSLSIKDSYDDSEVEETGKYFKRTIRYTSPHAWIVEHGGIGFLPYKYDGAYPIGAEQGGAVIFAKTAKLQEGYHYLENAIRSITKDDIDYVFSKYLR